MISNLKLIISELLFKLNFVNKNNKKDISKILKGLNNEGYYVMPSLLDEEHCDFLVEKTKRFITEQDDKVSHESNGCDRRIYGADRYDNDFNISVINAVSDKIYKYFEFSKKIDHFVLLGHIIGGDTNLGSGSGWHRDSRFKHQFKTIVYLNDVTLKNGPFQYLTKSHKRQTMLEVSKALNKPLKNYRFKNDEIDTITQQNLLETKTFTAQKGTVIFVNTRGIHRGSPLIEGERFALTRYHLTGGSKKFFKGK